MNTNKTSLLLIIAITAHEINRAYCLSIGDESQLPWAEAPDWQKESAIKGVEFNVENPDATPQDSHDSWMIEKLDNGWVYGEVKDTEAKTHPCLVDYDQLPAEQKTKDYLYQATVKTLLGFKAEFEAVAETPPAPPPAVENTQIAPTAVALSAIPSGFSLITYIGKRESYVDGLYGTRIAFNQGETKLVPFDKATLMLRHPDVYRKGVLEGEVDLTVPKDDDDKSKKMDDEELRSQELRDSVQSMGVEALKTFVQTNFNQKLHHNIGVDKARSEAVRLIDQYGTA